jgi:hypothetical protein
VDMRAKLPPTGDIVIGILGTSIGGIRVPRMNRLSREQLGGMAERSARRRSRKKAMLTGNLDVGETGRSSAGVSLLDKKIDRKGRGGRHVPPPRSSLGCKRKISRVS